MNAIPWTEDISPTADWHGRRLAVRLDARAGHWLWSVDGVAGKPAGSREKAKAAAARVALRGWTVGVRATGATR